MSDITEAKTALKKILTLIEEVNKITSDSMSNLKSEPDKILQNIEKFEGEKNSELKTIETNIEEISTLKNKFSQNENEIAKFDEEIVDLTKERQELSDKIQTTQNELSETQEKIKSVKSEFDNRSSRLIDLEKGVEELTTFHEQFEEKIKELEAQLQIDFEKKDMFVKSFKNKTDAMRSLIKKDYLKNLQVRIIKSLQKDLSMELGKIITTLDIKENDVRRILSKMAELGGPIDYNANAGTVKLTGEVDF